MRGSAPTTGDTVAAGAPRLIAAPIVQALAIASGPSRPSSSTAIAAIASETANGLLRSTSGWVSEKRCCSSAADWAKGVPSAASRTSETCQDSIWMPDCGVIDSAP